MTLPEIRHKIDALDDQILRLLKERADLVHLVGEAKRAAGQEFYAPEREAQVLRSLAEKNQSLGSRLPELGIRAIYREIMSASLALEKDLSIACIAASRHAAQSRFGDSLAYLALDGLRAVFDAVGGGRADYGVVPLESGVEGEHTLDLLVNSALKVCAQVPFRLGQGPVVRFLVLGRSASPSTGEDQTMVALSLRDEPGALVAALDIFRTAGINLGQITSRPPQSGRGEIFVLELDGHAEHPPLFSALEQLGQRVEQVKVLGTFPRVNAS